MSDEVHELKTNSVFRQNKLYSRPASHNNMINTVTSNLKINKLQQYNFKSKLHLISN